MAITESLIDKRVVARNIDKGLVDAKELEKHIKGLPDIADKGEIISYAEEGDEDEDSED
jgi:hypothetical protein